MSKPTIPEVVDRFRAYHDEHPSWGPLHVVLDDQNVDDYWVQACIKFAVREGDWEGSQLAYILLTMSKTQRLKLSHLA